MMKLEKDISRAIFYLVKTETFLANIFPIGPDIIDIAYDNLVRKKQYNPNTKRWKGLSKTSSNERIYYKPFAQVVESIRTVYASLDHNASPNCQWINNHSTPARLLEETTSLARPDVLCMLKLGNEEQSRDGLMDIYDEVSSTTCLVCSMLTARLGR
jgi:hypothetical protein